MAKGRGLQIIAPRSRGSVFVAMIQTSSFIGAPREWAVDLAIVVGVGAILGVIGPFGSFDGSPLELRIVYWIGNFFIGFTILSMISRLSLRLAARLDLPDGFALGAGVLVGAIPLAIALNYFSAWVWPPMHGRPRPFLMEYGQVLVLSEPFTFAYYYLADRGWRSAVRAARAEVVTPGPAASSQTPQSQAFLERMPPRLGRDLLCLQMEDHYVRAHAAAGSALILVTLKEAIAGLGGLEGLQVHRSWWVSKSAVVDSVTSGRNVSLRLTNGLEVPVARTAVARLRAAGWLSGDAPRD